MKLILVISVFLLFSCVNKEQQSINQNTIMLLQKAESNLYTGRIVQYYFDGRQKQFVEKYKGGSKNGWYKSWHKNGRIKVIGKFSKDHRIGVWKWFRENGQCEYQYQYKYQG